MPRRQAPILLALRVREGTRGETCWQTDKVVRDPATRGIPQSSAILTEIRPLVTALVANFVSDEAQEFVSGRSRSTAILPFEVPSRMAAASAQLPGSHVWPMTRSLRFIRVGWAYPM